VTRKLLVVAASGLVVAILLLSAAWVVGGKDMVTALHHGGWHFTVDDDDHAATVTHTVAFDAGAPLALDAPVDVHFVRGDRAAMTVSGAAPLVAAMRWQDNRLSMSDAPMFIHHTLHVEIVAPRLPPLTLAGPGNVSIEKLDQDDLQLSLRGAGNVDASGRVRTVTVNNSGAGNVDLGELDATDATVTTSGIGNVDLKATGKVAVTLSGVGNVSLHRKPAELTSRINGIGSITQDY